MSERQDSERLVCEECGEPMGNVKCTTSVPHEKSECNFVCPICGKKADPGPGCLQGITIASTFTMPVELHGYADPPGINEPVSKAVGEIILGYALVENTLRRILSKVDGHNERSNLTNDIERLVKNRNAIVERARNADERIASAMENCIDQIKESFDKVHQPRNAIAHGQMVGAVKTEINIPVFADEDSNKPDESWIEVSHPTYGTVKLKKDRLHEIINDLRALESEVGKLGTLAKQVNDITRRQEGYQ